MSYSNPAQEASKFALDAMFQAINDKCCFRLEAGAGAGKTYSLIEALKFLIHNKSSDLAKTGQRIACITYTNVAKKEILERTDNHPVVYTETIHGFSWSLIQGFQSQLKIFLPQLSDKWMERLNNIGGITNQRIKYDLGYPSADAKEISLHHDDVIKLITLFLDLPKFQRLVYSKFPIIFIDEYQDTNKELASAIIRNLVDNESGILIGFFGDHWQKIYGSNACGLIKSEKNRIIEIGKNANFRSDKKIVDVLNRMRPELPQQIYDPNSIGDVYIFHSNNWGGTRLSTGHWKGDLPASEAHDFLEATKKYLGTQGWDFSPEKTKILMLTNNLLANEQSYNTLADCFTDTDDYIKQQNSYIKFFLGTIEPLCEYFESRRFGEMFKVLDKKTLKLTNQSNKELWITNLTKLLDVRNSGTINDVLNLLKDTQHPRLSAKVEDSEKRFTIYETLSEDEKNDIKEKAFYQRVSKLKLVKYKEVICLNQYIQNRTPFSTKHGVKGAQFENVLVVCGRGWNHYDWNQLLEWLSKDIPSGKEDTFERNRNLFYVCISRSQKRLAILFTQGLSSLAMQSVEKLFSRENVLGDPLLLNKK